MKMADSKADAEAEALRSWYTRLLDKVVKEMISVKAVSGDAVQAAPVWMVPNEVLIAKVWGISNEHDFVWAISIDKLIADYVAGSLAGNPREVAKHFALKWQMDADRLVSFGSSQASDEVSPEKMQAYSEKLIQYAEALYEMTGRDEPWEEQQSFSN
jgi:uncharacterized protein DUF4826